MLKVVEKISCRVGLEWEQDGIYSICTDGYILENGVTVADVEGSYESSKALYEPVIENDEIIGFNRIGKAELKHRGAFKRL